MKMKIMKTLSISIVTLALAFGFVGCGSKDSDSNPGNQTTKANESQKANDATEQANTAKLSITLVNETDVEFYTLSIAPEDTMEWSADLFGTSSMLQGGEFDFEVNSGRAYTLEIGTYMGRIIRVEGLLVSEDGSLLIRDLDGSFGANYRSSKGMETVLLCSTYGGEDIDPDAVPFYNGLSWTISEISIWELDSNDFSNRLSAPLEAYQEAYMTLVGLDMCHVGLSDPSFGYIGFENIAMANVKGISLYMEDEDYVLDVTNVDGVSTMYYGFYEVGDS